MTAPGPAPTALGTWLDQHTGRAPDALRRRVLEYAAATPPGTDVAHTLADAGAVALQRVFSRSGDRSVALDLLAADALVTLALLAQAQHGPANLGSFAAAILQAHRPPS
ncbi:MAG TPA: hypothetical protein VIE46_09125 [Gemmatimonadales bacterium]